MSPEESSKAKPSKPSSANKTCGNCAFAQASSDVHKIVCFGVPPTPIAVAGGKDFAGRQVLNFECIRPMLMRDSAPCSLYERRPNIGDLDVAHIDLNRFADGGDSQN